MKRINIFDLSQEELVQAFVFPHDLSAEEKASEDAKLAKMRLHRFHEMSEKERIYGNMLRLKYQKENHSTT